MVNTREIIADAGNWQRNICTKIFNEWCGECDVEAIVYDFSWSKHLITIYTTQPGLMIGLHGSRVDKYRKKFNEEFDEDFTIEFKELKGKVFVSSHYKINMEAES